MISVGLYKHFKGGYYFVKEITKDETLGIPYAVYFDVINPTGLYSRPCDEFNDRVPDRQDNVTGQILRFEKVNSLSNSVKNISTEQLLKELRGRKDSPLQELDIKGLSDLVYSFDYVVGEVFEGTEEFPRGVNTVAVFNDEETAKKYLIQHRLEKARYSLFKRTFIQR